MKKLLLAIIFVFLSLIIVGCNSTTRGMVGPDNPSMPVRDSAPEEIDDKEEDEEEIDDIDYPDGLEVQFIDVGDGDSILITTPRHKTVLIDCGIDKNADNLIEYLQSEVEEVDVLIVTHADAEHLGACDNILQEMEVEEVYHSGIRPPYDSQTYWDYYYEASKKHPIEVTSDMEINIDRSISFNLIVAYDLSRKREDPNDNSIMARLDYEDSSFLFTADCSDWCEHNITSQGGVDLDVDILKVSDSGNTNFTTNEFLKEVTPEIAVISVGPDNRNGYPTWSFLDKFSNIDLYRTNIHGTIIIETDGVDYKVKTERGI